jgi:hypothetical protein
LTTRLDQPARARSGCGEDEAELPIAIEQSFLQLQQKSWNGAAARRQATPCNTTAAERYLCELDRQW